VIQAQLAADALTARHPEHDFVLERISTHGDRNPSLRLSESPREGVFVKELEQALLDGRAELAVHSAKDLPTLPTQGLALAAFLPRAEARDVLVTRGAAGLAELPPGSRIGTGSPRRAAQINAVRPDLRCVEIRGNVDTRLRKLGEGEVDALVLAAAGLERLGRLDEASRVLPLDVMLPAPGQGAIALQAIADSDAARLAAAVDDPRTRRAVEAERALLRRLGGGCLSAVGAYGRVVDNELALEAIVLDESGNRLVRAGWRGPNDIDVVTEVAGRLLAEGADSLLAARSRPLTGLRVLVTRPASQAAGLAELLEARGAAVIRCPVIAIEPIEISPDRLERLSNSDWLVVTSANGVDRIFSLLAQARIEFPTHIKVAAIGPETAARLREYGREPAIVPDEYVAEALAERLAHVLGSASRVIIARAAGSRDVLPDRLRRTGATVDVIETYRAVPPADLADCLAQSLPDVEIVTFTSSSAVRHFADALDGRMPAAMQIACIGPITAEAARERGLPVAIIASEYTSRGLVDAIVRSRAPVSA
jgi:hydroxymethylbilane synthase